MDRTEIVNRYLQTLKLQKEHPSLSFLREITRRHLANFAFSSVGPRLGDDLPLDLESLYKRIVVRRRGGYCFEQNGLLFEVLEELGFAVTLCLGRVIYNQDTHPGLTHRISLVELDSKWFVVDVGFGPQGPRIPVRLTGEESREDYRVFRVAERRPGELHMQVLQDGEFFSLYRFEVTRYGQADCEVGHFYSHKHPNANFVNHLVVSRIMDDQIRSLRNRESWVITESGERKREIKDAPHLRTMLDSDFGVQVTETESQYLFDNAP